MGQQICRRLQTNKGTQEPRARIFVIILVVGCLPGVLLRYGIMQNYEQHAIELRTNTVQTQLKIANHLIHYNYLQDNSSTVSVRSWTCFPISTTGSVIIIGRNLKEVKAYLRYQRGQDYHFRGGYPLF